MAPFMVQVEAYGATTDEGTRALVLQVDRAVWDCNPDACLDAGLRELAADLVHRNAGPMNAYAVRSGGVRLFGGRISGGPQDGGEDLRHNGDTWRVLAAPSRPRLTRDDESSWSLSKLTQGEYRWTMTGWKWQGDAS